MGVAEDEVRIEKVSKVMAATGGRKGRVVFLTSCDLVCRSYPYINRVFFFKSECGKVPLQLVSWMKEGLARALVSFYPLAGRFCLDEEGRLQIDCVLEEGADFVEATCDLPFTSLALDGFQYRHVFWKLARRTHYLRCDYLHEPILSVQVTKFRDGGGYSVGVSMSHAVADAQSFYDFVKCWGEVCRGVAMSVPPLHMRDALSVNALFSTEKLPPFESVSSKVPNGCSDSTDQASMVFSVCDHTMAEDQQLKISASKEPRNGVTVVNALVEELEHINLVDKTGARSAAGQSARKGPSRRTGAPIMEKQMEEEEHRRPRSDLVQKVFSFSSEKLQQLKERANVDKTSSNGHAAAECNGGGASTEVLSKMWNDIDDADFKSKLHNRGFTTFEAFCAHWWQCFIRARRLPASQAVFLLIPINCRQRFLDLPKSYFGNALDGGLVKLSAGELCEAELGVVASKIHEAIKAATEEGFKQYIREAERKRNAIPHFDRTGLFHIVDSPKYPVYDVDFGFGSPVAVRAEGFRFGAEVQILAGRLGSGSYDLFCALDSDTMRSLDNDPSFLACCC